MPGHEAKFQIGELIHHKLFDYLGVVSTSIQSSAEATSGTIKSRAPGLLRINRGITCWSIGLTTLHTWPNKI